MHPYSLGVCIGSLFLLAVSFEIPLVDQYLWFLVLLFILPIIVIFFIALLAFPSEILTDIRIQQAKRKLLKHKHVQVVVVSGEGAMYLQKYIIRVLSTKFTIVSTLPYSSTSISIANTIIKKIHKDTDFLVVKIGKYKKEEIAKLMNMLQPDIAILDTSNKENDEFYHSKEKLIQAKEEMLYGLSKNGIAILGGDSDIIFELSKKTKKTKYFYATRILNVRATINVNNIKSTKNGVDAIIKMRSRLYALSAPYLTPETVQYTLPAILIAELYDIPLSKIKKSVFTLRSNNLAIK